MSPRPREFDEDHVLLNAMEVFWERGYESTSITDLMAATGLAKGSLYKGFGDKRSLFLRALQRYMEQQRRMFQDTLSVHKSPGAGLVAWLTHIVGTATRKGLRRGCMTINCVVELAPHEPDLRKVLRNNEKHFEKFYADTLERGVQTGEFRKDLDTDKGARFLLTLISGLQVQGKLGLSYKEATHIVELALRSFR